MHLFKIICHSDFVENIVYLTYFPHLRLKYDNRICIKRPIQCIRSRNVLLYFSFLFAIYSIDAQFANIVIQFDIHMSNNL